MMDINEFLGIAVVGAILSLVIEYVTTTFSTKPLISKAVTLALSVFVGGLYVWVRSTPFFSTVVTVLGCASIVYAFFLKK